MMKASRLTAVGIVAAAVLWIASGYLVPHEGAQGEAAVRPGEAKQQPLFLFSVAPVKIEPHAPKLTLSGRTEADRKVAITARTGGTLVELRVKRGQHV